MAVLERIRVKFGVAITVIIAIALLSFIIDPSTLSSVMYTMSSKYDVGQIDGKRIDYQRYQQDVDTYNKLNEIITGSSASTDEQQKNVRDAAWQALVDEYLFIKNCKAAGLFVGKDEKIDLTTGNAVSPVLAQDPNFADENGVFSVDRLKDFVQQVSSDESGRLKIYWDYLQKAVVTAAYYQKYTSLFTRSNVENTLLSARAIEENNTTADIEFVMTSVGYAADSTIQVTDKEVEKYYKAHKKNYKCEASRDIEYVVFEVKPSSEDIAAANEKIASLYDEFAKTDNPKTFLRNSDRKFDSRWYGKGELNSVDREVAEFVDANRVGAVSKVIEGDEAFYAVRILDKKMMPNDIDVKLAVAGNVDKIDAALEAKLDASQEMNMTQDRLVSGCEVLFDAPLNKVQLIDSPQYGKLAAKVLRKSAPVEKKQVAILSKNIVAGKATYNDYYSRANTMAVRSAGNYKSFKAAADSLHLYVNSQNRVLESTRTIGSVDGCAEVVRWVFDQKKGAVSNIISVANNAFFVVAVKEIREEGYTPLKEVAVGIRMNLYQDKIAAKRSAEVAEKIAGMETMAQVAEALGTEVSTKEGVAFSAAGGQSLDPVLVGAVSSAETGKISGPVHNAYSIYVYNVLSRETGSFYNEDDAKALDAQKAQYYAQMIVPVMSEGKVKDNRARFY